MPLHPLQQEHPSRCLHEIQEGRSGSCYCSKAFCCDLGFLPSSSEVLDNLTARRHYSKARYPRKTAFDSWLKAIPEQTSNTTAASSAQDIINFYLIFASLPLEMKIQVLSHLDPVSLLSITEIPAPQPVLWSPRWKLSSLCTIAQARVDIDDILEKSSEHLRELAIRHQYPVEAFICPCKPRHYLTGFWFQCTINKKIVYDSTLLYLLRLHHIDTRVSAAAYAIQSMFPRMAQTAMARDALTYMFYWTCRNVDSHDPVSSIQHQWNFFGWLPRWIKLEISTFFDNLAEEFLDAAPLTYPSVCRDPHCPNRAANDAPRNVVRCQCCGLAYCWWRLPSRIINELNALGVTRLLARQNAICRIRTLLSDASEMRFDPGYYWYEDFFISRLHDGFTWQDALHGAEIKYHSPRDEIIIYLPSWKILIILSGKRGHGSIEIKVAPQFRASFHDPQFMMHMAMSKFAMSRKSYSGISETYVSGP